MRRRTFVVSVASLLALPAPAITHETGKIWRIGYLSLVSERLEQYRRWIGAFRDGLRELGYFEGRNTVIEQRYATGQVESLFALAKELLDLKVDVLVTAPAGSAVAAKTI